MYLASEVSNENSTPDINEKYSFLTNTTVPFMTVRLFEPMSSGFTVMFRSFYHKMALILFTL